jgi:hypothetical protein
MYYRNANCAVVVYDITQTVWRAEYFAMGLVHMFLSAGVPG